MLNPFNPSCGAESNPAIRRYSKRLAASLTYYCATIFLAAYWARHFHRSGLVSYAIAILPGLGVVAMVVTLGLYLKEEHDEFNRATQVEALLWATGLTLTIETVWGFLEAFADVPKAPLYLVFSLFCVIWGVAVSIVRRRYQ
jgi:hypothetical protein